jgi:hypothetical protein
MLIQLKNLLKIYLVLASHFILSATNNSMCNSHHSPERCCEPVMLLGTLEGVS